MHHDPVVNEAMERARVEGSFYFSKDTLRFFGSRFLAGYPAGPVSYLVETCKTGFEGPRAARVVRAQVKGEWNIYPVQADGTRGTEYMSTRRAHAVARRLAEKGV